MLTIEIATTPNQYQKCLALRREIFILEQNVPESIEVDQYETTATHFLAELDQTPVATGRLRIKNDWIKFERIATSKKHRGSGIGRSLMLYMQEYASKHFSNLTPAMHAQLDAVPFYEKLGWIPQGEIFFEASIPHKLLFLPKSNR